MTRNDTAAPDLDALLAGARDEGPLPSDALIARVMADAVALQPRPGQGVSWEKPVGARWLDRLAALFGGGGALAGVSLALMAGVFIGISQPEPVVALTQAFWDETQSETVDLFPANVAVWEEATDD